MVKEILYNGTLYSVQRKGPDLLITFDTVTGFLWWKRKVTVSYRGNCSVWHNSSTGERASGAIDCVLNCVWKLYKWEGTE